MLTNGREIPGDRKIVCECRWWRKEALGRWRFQMPALSGRDRDFSVERGRHNQSERAQRQAWRGFGCGARKPKDQRSFNQVALGI